MPQCEDKKPFTKKEAQENRNYRSRRGAQGLRIYQCYNCNFWHLTSKPYFGEKEYEKDKSAYRKGPKRTKEYLKQHDELL